MFISTCLTALATTPLILTGAPSQPGTTSAIVPSSATPGPTSPATAETKGKKADKQKYEQVQFKTEDKLTLHANFFAPKKKGRMPAVILVHDAGSNAESMTDTAESLQRKGFACLAIDLRGHGASIDAENDWSKLTDLDARARLWAFAMRDLKAASEYLRDLDNVHSSNLSVVGLGAGACLAAKHALNDENARAVAFIEPDPEIYGYNMMRDVNDLGGLPALIMTTDSGRSVANRIKNGAAKANGGDDFVKIQSLKPKKDGDLFSDKRLNTELVSFLKDEAMDKR